MKKLVIIVLSVIIILWASLVNAQTKQISYRDTSHISIPTYVAKKIIVDLVAGDSLHEEVKVTKSLLELTEKKVILKDSLIYTMQSKIDIYNSQLDICNKKDTEFNNYIVLLNKELKKERVKNKIISSLSVLGLITGSVFLLSSF